MLHNHRFVVVSLVACVDCRAADTARSATTRRPPCITRTTIPPTTPTTIAATTAGRRGRGGRRTPFSRLMEWRCVVVGSDRMPGLMAGWPSMLPPFVSTRSADQSPLLPPDHCSILATHCLRCCRRRRRRCCCRRPLNESFVASKCVCLAFAKDSWTAEHAA